MGRDVETKEEFFSKKSDIGDNALKVLEKRYLKKDKEGKSMAETAEGLFKRVSLRTSPKPKSNMTPRLIPRPWQPNSITRWHLSSFFRILRPS